jgi:hypothetical protein
VPAHPAAKGDHHREFGFAAPPLRAIMPPMTAAPEKPPETDGTPAEAELPGDEAETLAELLPAEQQIEHFLSGRTRGRGLFAALYDEILDEPVPERLLDPLRKARRRH